MEFLRQHWGKILIGLAILVIIYMIWKSSKQTPSATTTPSSGTQNNNSGSSSTTSSDPGPAPDDFKDYACTSPTATDLNYTHYFKNNGKFYYTTAKAEKADGEFADALESTEEAHKTAWRTMKLRTC